MAIESFAVLEVLFFFVIWCSCMMLRFAAVVLFIFPFGGASYAATSLPLELEDGVTLDATYFAGSQPGPGLLFLNMCDPSRDQSEWNDVATALAHKGYHILIFDYRGFGQSDGDMPMNLRSASNSPK